VATCSLFDLFVGQNFSPKSCAAAAHHAGTTEVLWRFLAARFARTIGLAVIRPTSGLTYLQDGTKLANYASGIVKFLKGNTAVIGSLQVKSSDLVTIVANFN